VKVDVVRAYWFFRINYNKTITSQYWPSHDNFQFTAVPINLIVKRLFSRVHKRCEPFNTMPNMGSEFTAAIRVNTSRLATVTPVNSESRF